MTTPPNHVWQRARPSRQCCHPRFLRAGPLSLGRYAAMRTALSIVCFVLCSCDLSPPANPFSKEVTDKTGTNRLALNYVSAAPGLNVGEESFAFHSLAWRTKVGTNWSNRVLITKSDFEAGGVRPRWVQDIYSFDPTTGNAVIMVAEVSAPQTNGNSISTVCIYSWREWNIATNAEVRVLRVCKDPFEPYTGRRIKLFK